MATPAVDQPAVDQTDTDAAHRLVRSRLLAFQKIGGPLMAAVSDWRYVEGSDDSERTAEQDAELFGKLVTVTGSLAAQLAEKLAPEDADDPAMDWLRWGAATAASDIVTASFRALGAVPDASLIERLALALDTGDAPGDVAALGAEDALEPEPLGADETLRLQIRSLTALAPVVGAVARYAFGHDAEALVEQVAGRLHARSMRVARRLAPESCSLEDWQALYLGVFAASAELYADCHYAEMDRLLDMNSEERRNYADEHGERLPMDPVWAGFELRVGMLTGLAENLTPPPVTVIDPPGR